MLPCIYLIILSGVYVCVCACSLSCVQLFVTPWTVAYQAPLSMGFSRQEYWSGLSFPSPGGLPDPGIEPTSSALVGGFTITWATWEAQYCLIWIYKITLLLPHWVSFSGLFLVSSLNSIEEPEFIWSTLMVCEFVWNIIYCPLPYA